MDNKRDLNSFKGKVFNTENLKYIDNPITAMIDGVAILLGDYEAPRKHAAKLLLKALLRDEFLEALLEDMEVEKAKGAKKSCEA
ncbi:hypothetical protein ACJDU8_22125 [Clostridium sp. WILCCON 0269]|uniref:Uncharacterized protein n=1 Tax=Candidatus Clostridium eludens TaxID=3381663 RepID=A0ABW8SR17_9CLOT